MYHVLGGTAVAPGVLQPRPADGEPGHGGVRGSHPQRVRVLPHHPSQHAHSGLEVYHGVVVVPEHELRGHQAVPQLAADGDAVPEVDMLLPRSEDGGGGLVDPQPGSEGLDA